MPGSQTMATTAVTVAPWRLLGTGTALGFHAVSSSALTITQSPSPFHRRQGTRAVVVAQATLGFSCPPTFLRHSLKHSPCSSHTPPLSSSLIPLPSGLSGYLPAKALPFQLRLWLQSSTSLEPAPFLGPCMDPGLWGAVPLTVHVAPEVGLGVRLPLGLGFLICEMSH